MTQRTMLPQGVRFTIFRRDNFTCRYCGRSSPAVVLHVEHVQPVARGGKDDPANLVTACADCNRGKGATKGVLPPPLPTQAAEQASGLAGMWGHVLDDDGYINQQFTVLRPLGGSRWLVQWFSWWDGDPSECGVLEESAILGERCRLYANAALMNWYYEHGGKRRPDRLLGA